jgi:hypothetical protein
MVSWNSSKQRKQTKADYTVAVIVVGVALTLAGYLAAFPAQAGTVPPFPTMSSTSWVATPTRAPAAPQHTKVYLPLIQKGGA